MNDKFKIFDEIVEEMTYVYKHDNRPWLIGYSGGKDSSLLVSLVFEVVMKISPAERTKKIYVVTSDTGVENPIVKNYMHFSSKKINEFSEEKKLNIISKIIYPPTKLSFWSLIIGLGYPTPEPPGFRWCTEKLKINPMNDFTNKVIEEYGEIILLLGVRKGESIARKRSITTREIVGKLLIPHNDIKKAYVYNPLTEIPNDLVWEYLLRNDGISSWGVDMKYLFNLYQGENLGEEESAVGQIDKEKISITGNSRFGCWCCTIVKEDKSLQNFIDHGSKELLPLKEFRNWLVDIRNNSEYRETKRRNGSVYQKANGEFGFGPFNMYAREEILKKLLTLQRNTGMELISMEELKEIDSIWDLEGDLSQRKLVNIYFDIFGQKLPWDEYKRPVYDKEIIDEIKKAAIENDIPYELITKLIVTINNNKFIANENKMEKEFDKIINQEWIHFNSIKAGIRDEDNKDSI